MPTDHLEAPRELSRQVDPGKGDMTERNRMRLRVFDDPVNVERLNLPESVMKSLARLPDPGYNDAVRAQTALAIAIELVAPLRAKNLAGLRLDRHLIRSRPGPGAVIHLVIPLGEVKNKIPLEFELPPDVVRILELYLQIPTPSCDRWLQLIVPGATGRSQDSPGSGDAHHVLGNTPAMTEKHYNQAQSLEASRRHNCHARRSPGSLNA
jgi:hypothetical protein